MGVPAVQPIRLMAPPKSGEAKRGAFDAFGRQMTYLRISLTDRCNFRCLYCMPPTGMQFQPRDEMLSDPVELAPGIDKLTADSPAPGAPSPAGTVP